MKRKKKKTPSRQSEHNYVEGGDSDFDQPRSTSRRAAWDDDGSMGFPEYVPVGERRDRATRAANKLVSDGHSLEPVYASKTAIATSFWGRSWCRNLERYSDYESRLPRGRSYLRSGCVLDLQIKRGRIEAKVQGTRLYEVVVRIEPLEAERWRDLCVQSQGEVHSLLDLLAGKISAPVMAIMTEQGTGLFPEPSDIKLGCTCPDWADMCKHVAAVLYGIGVRLDERPELLFQLRGVEQGELIAAAVKDGFSAMEQQDSQLTGVDLGALFGIELDLGIEFAPESVNERSVAAPKSKASKKANTLKNANTSKKAKSSKNANTSKKAKSSKNGKTSKTFNK